MTRFSKGMGRLNAQMLNHMADAVHEVDQFDPNAIRTGPRAVGPIPCKITSSTAMNAPADGRWIYTVVEVLFTNDRTIEDLSGATDQPLNSWNVINLREMGNTTTVHDGVTIADLPGTFALQPIPNGAMVMVWLSGNGATTGQQVTAFFEAGSYFYGECS